MRPSIPPVLGTLGLVCFVLLANAQAVTQSGWSLKGKNSFGWAMVIASVLSAVAVVMMIFNVWSGAVGISTLLGLQVLLTGIALVLLSFAKKVVARTN